MESARELAACENSARRYRGVRRGSCGLARPRRRAEDEEDGSGAPPLPLVENPDILDHLQASEPAGLVVGFAAETETVVAHATAKRARKGCD